MTQPKVDKLASARTPTKGVASIKRANQHEQPKVDKVTDYNKGFEAGVRTVASAIGREKTFDAKLFNGNYFLRQPDGTYFSINSLSKYKDK